MKRGTTRSGWLVALVAILPAASLSGASEVLDGLDFGGLAPREVRVYLPPEPVTTSTPVLVALDGQNMAAWKLEPTLAGIAELKRFPVPLVVAIAAGPDRLDEYGLPGLPDYAGRGRRAAEFQHFVIDRVLPAVRAKYGIRADPARTGVMGASLGGLAAFALAWQHPEVFGLAGIFSGSFWWRGEDGSPAVRQASRLAHRMVRETPERGVVPRLYFTVETNEETDDRDGNGVIDAVQDTTELIDELARRGLKRHGNLAFQLVEGGEHNEAAWARELGSFLWWAQPHRSAN
jgi:enterochelin esterase family protein